MAKILLINGSPKNNGCTAFALQEMIKVFDQEGIESEVVNIGKAAVQGCTDCGFCQKNGKCVYDDVNEIAKKFEQADGLVIGSPVYYGSPNGSLLSLLDRLMFSENFPLQMKVGAAIVSARRGGNTGALDTLNKYFLNKNMILAGSTYWNMVHGFTPEDVQKDPEGLQTMRNLAHNMAFLVKAIRDAKDKYGLPEVETQYFTCFHDGK